MADTPVVSQPAPEQSPQVSDPNLVELNRLKAELAEFRTREGRFRNEKGVMAARIRELEQLALGNQTETPEYGAPTYAPPQPQYGQYQPPQFQPLQAPPQDTLSREEFDLYRFKSEHADRYETVRSIALDPAKVQQFIRYRPGPYGAAVPDVYGTYTAISQQLELEELRKAQQANQPQRNPAMGTISGSGAASQPEGVDIADKTPDELRQMFPEAFAPQNWGR